MNEETHFTDTLDLPPGLSMEALSLAVSRSGYPLQGVVAGKLSDSYGVTEEWAYVDKDTEQHRSLDIFAYRKFGEAAEDSSVHPAAILLLECKKSVNPFVFFRSSVNRPIPEFPRVVGARKVDVYQSGKGLHQEHHISDVLGLSTLPYVEPGPPRCSAFSKATPKGKEAELSGDDPFSRIILPLVKACSHAADYYRPHQVDERLNPSVVGLACIVDAPMVLVDDPATPDELKACNWVRIVRQEPAIDRWSEWRHHAIDMVHADYFERWRTEHFEPFAGEFATRAIAAGEILLHGAETDDLKNWSYEDLKPRSL